MKLSRRGLLVAGAAALAARPAGAASIKPTILLVGAPTGSTEDRFARAFAPFLERHLRGTRMTVVNIAGDGGVAAARILAIADPLNPTLGFVSTPKLSARMITHDATALMARIRLLGAVHKEPITIVSPAATPLASAHDIFRRAGTDGLPFGTPAPGSPAHLAALRLQAETGKELNIVAFPSSVAVRQAVLAGHVAAAALSLSEVLEPLRDGRLIGLGIAAKERLETLPDLPALRDIGLPLSAFIRRGLAVPATTPEEIVQTLTTAMRAVLDDPEFTTQANETGLIPFWTAGPVWTRQIESEQADLARLWKTTPWSAGVGG